MTEALIHSYCKETEKQIQSSCCYLLSYGENYEKLTKDGRHIVEDITTHSM